MTGIQPGELLADLTEQLRGWMAGQRWFAAKGRELGALGGLRASVLVDGDPALLHATVAVHRAQAPGNGATAGPDAYQLLLGVRAHLPDHLAHAVIGHTHGLTVYEAMHDAKLMGVLLELLATGEDRGGLRLRPEPGAELATGLRARPISGEQSNTSVIFGHDYILKIYRRPSPATNRDLLLHRALHEVGSKHIATPLGAIHGELDDKSVVYGFLQEFLPNSVEGWAAATASMRDLLAEADLHADEVGGDFAGEAGRLGSAVAEVHASLATALGTEQAGAEVIDAEVNAMHARLDRVLTEVPRLARYEPTLRAAFDQVRELPTPITVQHVHGDLHLGQALRTNNGWVLIDFEGEPAAPAEQRSVSRSPLRDVAGMLRSFDYAAFHQLANTLHDSGEDRQLTARATEWSDRNREAFCAGYAAVAGDPREQHTLLRAFELDKAVYEVAYEHHNRPDWVSIPLSSIARTTAQPDIR